MRTSPQLKSKIRSPASRSKKEAFRQLVDDADKLLERTKSGKKQELNKSPIEKKLFKSKNEQQKTERKAIDGDYPKFIIGRASDFNVNSEAMNTLKEKINDIIIWEKQIRMELELKNELEEKERLRQMDQLEEMRKNVEEKDKIVRNELYIREKRTKLDEEKVKSQLERLNLREEELKKREEGFEEMIRKKVDADTEITLDKLRNKFQEVEKMDEKIRENEKRINKREKQFKENFDQLSTLQNEKDLLEQELIKTKADLKLVSSRLEGRSDYHSIRIEINSLKREIVSLKDALKGQKLAAENRKISYEEEETRLKRKNSRLENEVKRLEEERLSLQEKFQWNSDKMSSTYKELVKEYDVAKKYVDQLKRRDEFLTEQVMDLQERCSRTVNKEPKKSMACHLCEDVQMNHWNYKRFQQSHLDFLARANECITELKAQTKLIGERNKMHFQLDQMKVPKEGDSDGHNILENRKKKNSELGKLWENNRKEKEKPMSSISSSSELLTTSSLTNLRKANKKFISDLEEGENAEILNKSVNPVYW